MNPKQSVCTLIFLKKADQILLAEKKRGFGQGLLNGIGGKIEAGETIEQALLRETNEEITVTPMNYWKVAEHSFIQDADTDPWKIYMHVYLCDEWHGQPQETDEMAPEWFNIQDIPYARMWADDEFWLPQVLAGQRVYGEFTFDENDKLISHDVQVVETLPHEVFD
ncbi:MAG TPA: 8-oxo-dGTP diphosphatase [Candidatus Saccharimonadales bacterium]|nr:8-oxo-dGTP diphosphatase [Candidatus Saccharimonadales bacterium]